MVLSNNRSLSQTQSGPHLSGAPKTFEDVALRGRSVEMLLEQHQKLLTDVEQRVAKAPTVAEVVVTKDMARLTTFEARLDAVLESLGEERDLRKLLKTQSLTAAQRDALQSQERSLAGIEKSILRDKSRLLVIKNNLGDIPAEVPLLLGTDEAVLFKSLRHHRAAFWDALYRIPYVRDQAIAQLEQVACEERPAGYAIFSSRHKQRSGEDLLKLVRLNLPTIRGILQQVDVVPTKEQESKLVKLLVEVPLQPNALLQLLTRVREKTIRLEQVSNELEGEFGRVDAPAAMGNARYEEYQKLFEELGGGKRFALRRLAKLESSSEPYRRLKAYIVAANVGLVRRVVNAVEKDMENRADLDSDGTIGLMLAVEKFDDSLGTKFSTLATWWIRQAVLRMKGSYLHPVILPAHQQRRLTEITRNSHAGHAALGDDALAKKLGVDMPTLTALKARIARHRSLDTLVGTEQDSSLGSLIPDGREEDPSRPLSREEIAQVVRYALGRMHEADRTVLELRWGLRGEPMTLEQIAVQRGVTRERIRQIQDRAQKRLARGPMAKLLAQFLE